MQPILPCSIYPGLDPVECPHAAYNIYPGLDPVECPHAAYNIYPGLDPVECPHEASSIYPGLIWINTLTFLLKEYFGKGNAVKYLQTKTL